MHRKAVRLSITLLFSAIYIALVMQALHYFRTFYDESTEEEPKIEKTNVKETKVEETKVEETKITEVYIKPWYLLNGTRYPLIDSKKRPIWPEDDTFHDRIEEQLMFMPSEPISKIKKIYVVYGGGPWTSEGLPPGRKQFLNDKCPVSQCEFTRSGSEADLVIFKDRLKHVYFKRKPGQIWALFLLENPYSGSQSGLALSAVGGLNWTMTYNHQSDIVTPYEKFVKYPVKENVNKTNYARGKTKKVAMFVSNCATHNERLQYARQLSRFIQVDIYGRCGTKRCPKSRTKECFKSVERDYKFYLSFENANCRDYITEKLFVNALQHNVLPIVMGAHPDDYKRAAPENSFIHVDEFKSPKHLAEYLHHLDRNDDHYNKYFEWKGSGEFINTYFWCRVCALLHAKRSPKTYKNVIQWWKQKNSCSRSGWRKNY